MRNIDEITGAVINCALDIHRRLGPVLVCGGGDKGGRWIVKKAGS